MTITTYKAQNRMTTPITPYQELKNGKWHLIESCSGKTAMYAPTLFYMDDAGQIAAQNPEIGGARGYLTGTKYNAHIRRMLNMGLMVTTWACEEDAQRCYDVACSDYWAYWNAGGNTDES